MNRSFIVGVCIAAVALLPIAARAQDAPPQYPPPPQYQPPPPEGQPPPPPQYPPPQYQAPQYQQPLYQAPQPQYYSPPPRPYFTRPYYAPPPTVRGPSTGMGSIVAGSIFLVIGLIFIGVSVPFWQAGCGDGHTCFNDRNSADYSPAVGGLMFDIFGGLMFVSGAVLLPIGIAQASRYSRWRAAQRVQVAPTGLKLTF